jgi:hypothetical protein
MIANHFVLTSSETGTQGNGVSCLHLIYAAQCAGVCWFSVAREALPTIASILEWTIEIKSA